MTTTPTIVYVEDNEGDILLLKQAFQERFVQVELQIISNGEQALRYLRVKETNRDAPPPDLILLDLHLPKIDGDELMTHIQDSAYLREIPWFIFAEPRGDQALHGRDIPKDRCLIKPPAWEGYLEMVDRLMAAIHQYRRQKR